MRSIVRDSARSCCSRRSRCCSRSVAAPARPAAPRQPAAANSRAAPSSSPPTACARTSSRKYAAQGVAARPWRLPQERDHGLRQRPPDPGAAEHGRRLVHASPPGAWPGVTARPTTPSTSTASRSRNRTAAFDAGRPPGRDRSPSPPSAAASRSPRSSGPAAATRRSTARRSTSGPSSRAAASRRTTSSPARRRGVHRRRSASSSTIPPASPASAPFPAAAPVAGDRLDRTSRRRTARRMEMRLRVLDFGIDKYGLNAYIYDSTNDGARQLRPRPVLADQGRRGRRSPTCAEGEWADVKVTDRRRLARRA